MSFGYGLLILDCRPMLHACFAHVPPSLKLRYPRASLCCFIRKVRASPICASGPSSNGEGEKTKDYTTASQVSPVEAQTSSSDSEMRTRSSAWGSLARRLPVVGSWFGGQSVVSSEDGEKEINWGGILDPTPDNLLALLLTGLLGLAALQIFWQLFLVAITITLAALKYSVIAAILLALLIVFL